MCLNRRVNSGEELREVLHRKKVLEVDNKGFPQGGMASVPSEEEVT